MLKIILVGYGELASSLLLGIADSRHKIIGVFPYTKVKRQNFITKIINFLFSDKFASLIKAYKIPVINAHSINSENFIKQALKLKPDIILIGAWGEILKKPAIILPKIACINCHPSLLPKHRGNNPYMSVIKEGETKTGITFHLIDEGVDTGAILLQKEVFISNDDTGGSLRDKCAYKAKGTVAELLNEIENANLLPKKQDESQASNFSGPNKEDFFINWNMPAQFIHNQIRGMSPWFKCFTKYKNEFLIINSSKIVELSYKENKSGKILAKIGNGLLISTGDSHKAVLVRDLKIYGFLEKFFSDWFINKIKTGEYLENFNGDQ